MAIKAKDNAAIISGIVTMIAGILLIVTYWYAEEWFYIALGVVSIVAGVLAIFGKKLGA